MVRKSRKYNLKTAMPNNGFEIPILGIGKTHITDQYHRRSS
jgi:hypothetical protein